MASSVSVTGMSASELMAPREGTVDLETPSGQQHWGNPLAYYLFVLQGGLERCCRARSQQGAWQRMRMRGGCGALAAAEQLAHLREVWGRQWGRGVFEGTSEGATLGCRWGCCGVFFSKKIHGRAGSIYVFARKSLQLLCNTGGTTLWQEFLQMTSILQSAYSVHGLETNWSSTFLSSLSAIQQYHGKLIFNYKEVSGR